jgi:hypothetical protein
MRTTKTRAERPREQQTNASVQAEIALLAADILDLAFRRFAVPKDLEEALGVLRSQLEGLGSGRLDVEHVRDSLASVASAVHRLPRDPPAGRFTGSRCGLSGCLNRHAARQS